MDLVGRLSNSFTTSNLQFLTTRDWRKGPKRRLLSDGPRPDGRRAFATVSSAVVKVLAQAESELRVKDIHLQVEEFLVRWSLAPQ
jgi:hypothetical protein